MRKSTSAGGRAVESDTLHPGVVAVNAAVVAFVDDLLRMPSPVAASTIVSFLYGDKPENFAPLTGHVNGGIHIPLHALLTSPRPLAILLPQRLKVTAVWRKGEQALKGARAAARARYRELQAAFVTQGSRTVPEASASLVRYTYGSEGRQWLWEDAAARVMHRVTVFNRAILGLLASAARNEARLELPVAADAVAVQDFDLPDSVLDLMAAALPPVAAPDWHRFTEALHGSAASLYREESVVRYQSLLAEILGLATVREEGSV